VTITGRSAAVASANANDCNIGGVLILQRYKRSRLTVPLADESCEFERSHRRPWHGRPDGFGDQARLEHVSA
jgi:hypothetical protein